MKQLLTFFLLACFALTAAGQSKSELLRRAKAGNAEAQCDLGDAYYYGFTGYKEDYNQAVKWYTKAANQGHAKAQDQLGCCYMFGKGVTTDNREAEKWFRKSAAQGFNGAYFSLGLLYENMDKNKAIYWFKKCADDWWATRGKIDETSTRKLRELGVEYHPGGSSYSSSNNDKFANRVKIASDPDNPTDPKEQLALAFRYYGGDGVAKDYSKAVYWSKKAAEQGLAVAQTFYGSLYESGKGVSKNYEQAVYWYRKAAEQGEYVAQYSLGVCYTNAKGVSEDYTQAAYWFRKAAEQGYAEAQAKLGSMYYLGNGVPKDKEQSIYWLNKAAEQGNAVHKYILELVMGTSDNYWKE